MLYQIWSEFMLNIQVSQTEVIDIQKHEGFESKNSFHYI